MTPTPKQRAVAPGHFFDPCQYRLDSMDAPWMGETDDGADARGSSKACDRFSSASTAKTDLRVLFLRRLHEEVVRGPADRIHEPSGHDPERLEVDREWVGYEKPNECERPEYRR